MDDDIHQLLRQIAAEPSANLRQGLLFRLGTLVTPRRFARIFRAAPPSEAPWQLAPEWTPWVNTTAQFVPLSGKGYIEGFGRHVLSRAMTLYTNGQWHADKTLVIGLSGNVDRFMMPLPHFLQAMDARAVDVLAVRSMILKDGDGPPVTISELTQRINRRIAALPRYGRIAVLGTSMGGLPAVIVGQMIGADRVLAAGAGSPYRSWWTARAGLDPHDFLRGCDPGPKTTLLVGEDCLSDMAHAREIADLVPAETVCLSAASGPIGHMSLAALAVQKALVGFLDETLFGGAAASIAGRRIAPGLHYRR